MINSPTLKPAAKSSKTKSRPAAAGSPDVVTADPASIETPLTQEPAPSSDPVIVETVAAPLEEAPLETPVTTATEALATAEGSNTMVAIVKLPEIDVPEILRGSAEKTSQRIQESYEKIKASAQDMNDVLEDTFETTRTGIAALNTKALQLVQANNDAAFKFMKDFLAVKTVEDAVVLQTSFAKRQVETVSTQLKDLQALASETLLAVSQPSRQALVKAMKAI